MGPPTTGMGPLSVVIFIGTTAVINLFHILIHRLGDMASNVRCRVKFCIECMKPEPSHIRLGNKLSLCFLFFFLVAFRENDLSNPIDDKPDESYDVFGKLSKGREKKMEQHERNHRSLKVEKTCSEKMNRPAYLK